MISNYTELCEAIVEFQEMMEWDVQYEKMRKEVGKAQLVSNMIEEFDSIYAFAKSELEKVYGNDAVEG